MLVYLSMIDSADDQSKFEKIYWEYQNLMYYVASQLLKNPLDIEDAVHNAFVSIAERISEIEDPVCLKTKGYVVTITEHKAVDILRKQRHCSELAIEDAPAVLIDPESKSIFTDCMEQLPERYRQVILLKYYYGFSTKELAKELHISEVNAVKLDQRAKQKLLTICKENGVIL